MAQYVLGVDGGGTKTDVAAISLDGQVLWQRRLGPLNPVTLPDSPARVAGELMTLNAEAGEGLMALCVACAGAAAEEPRRRVRDALAQAGFTCPVSLLGDHENALWTAFGGEDGAVLCAGTGAVCYGRAGENTARAGGRGPVFDDGGGAYFIGREILSAVAKSLDGRGIETALTASVFAYSGQRDAGGVAAYYCAPERPRADIASLAVLLSPAAAMGDEAALAIMDKAARELAEMANAVLGALGGSLPLAMMGSVLANNRGLRTKTAILINAGHPAVNCRLVIKNAAVGAAEYALAQLKKNGA